MEQLAAVDVRFRPYGVTDRARLSRMADRLSADSLYTRFFSGTPRLPHHYLALLDGLDHWDREAMVALDGDEIAGIAEYVRHRGRPWRAELAVLVADRWQRHGIGGTLVAYLADLAARRGITEFDADVMFTNKGAVRFVRRGWPGAPSSRDGASTHFRLPLPASA
jgi:GNAT superfamily N-acetyltransferase